MRVVITASEKIAALDHGRPRITHFPRQIRILEKSFQTANRLARLPTLRIFNNIFGAVSKNLRRSEEENKCFARKINAVLMVEEKVCN